MKTGTLKYSDGQNEVEWTWSLSGNILILQKKGSGLIRSHGAEVLQLWLQDDEWLVREYETHSGQNDPMIVAMLWPKQ